MSGRATMDGAPWNDEMMTFVRTVLYDWGHRNGTVVMPYGSCVDMRGAIRFFERIDPGVEVIYTFISSASGDNRTPDTHYRKQDGEWVAYEPPDSISRERSARMRFADIKLM
jgi:hypothetical protein